MLCGEEVIPRTGEHDTIIQLDLLIIYAGKNNAFRRISFLIWASRKWISNLCLKNSYLENHHTSVVPSLTFWGAIVHILQQNVYVFVFLLQRH